MQNLEKEKLLIDKKTNENNTLNIDYEVKVLQNEIDKIKIKINDFQKIHNDDLIEKDKLMSNITEYKISINSIEESINNSKKAKLTFENENNSLNISIKNKQVEKTDNVLEKQKIIERNNEIENIINENKVISDKSKRNIQELEQQIASEEDELYNSITEINQSNQNIVTYQEKLNGFDVKREKHKMEIELLQNRMWDDYEITYGKAVDLQLEVKSINEVKKQIKHFKNEINELGNVNVNAIEEYTRTSERHNFLTVQRDDLLDAKSKLNKIIREMNSVMKQIFEEKFKLLNNNFNNVFKQLFGGGQAKLELSDMDNILESGIDIIVQPPGKKLQNMMLLSGGERAFTAIAILFSILKINPTPFCVLDEIEAALDDVNVYRFAEYLKEFSENTQFVMITHRKGTMENSDVLYGVTMQEYGVSKILSMKMEDTKAV